MQIHPYLYFPGNADEALSFYKSIFGGDFSSVMRYKDLPMEGVTLSEDEESKMMHIALPIGKDTVLMASDSLETLGQTHIEGNNVNISIHPATKSEADRIFTALSEDGKIVEPIADQPWGDYWGAVKDKFGIHWMVNFNEEWA
jgi:PhnB protein